MNQKFALLMKLLFAFLDLLLLNIIFFLLKRYLLEIPLPFNDREYGQLHIFINVEWLVCCVLYSVYEKQFIYKFENFFRRSIHTYVLFLMLTFIYLYFTRQLVISRFFVSIFLFTFLLSILLNRMIHLILWTALRNREFLKKRIMIIGYNDLGKKLAAYFERNVQDMQLVGFCEEQDKVKELSHYPILNTPFNAIQTSKELNVSEIYSTILPEQDKSIYNLMYLADQACIRFKLVPDLKMFVNRPMHLNYLSGMPVLSSHTEPLDDFTNRFKKRFIDIMLSSLVIVFVLSWLMPLIALAIWLESRGPIFFIQKRSGLNNKPFNCIKFRSMRVNKDADLKQANRHDERFTLVGKFIRKTNLDEFPQFFNVLKGDMSIVGPRPHMLKHTEDYSATISKYMVRQLIKPGITGWAQINGYRGEIRTKGDMQARVDHDLWYMENWNLMLDFKIIFLTSLNIVKGEENAF